MPSKSRTHIVRGLGLLAAGVLCAGAGEPNVEPSPDVTARIHFDRTSVFVQEAFEAVIELQVRGGDLHPRVRLDGMAKPGIEWAGFHELRAESVERDGRRYEVRRFRSRGRALAPGPVRFAPRVQVRGQPYARAGDRRDGWDFFYGRRPPAARLTVEADPVTIEVRPLPDAGRPASFSGAVGRFAFDVELDRTETRVGDPVSLRTIIEGEGNIEQARPPVLDPGAAFHAYEPRLVSHDVDPVRGRGRKVYEFVLLPREAGFVEIPRIAFSFFDPRAGAYQIHAHGPLALRVRPGPDIPDVPGEEASARWTAPHRDRPALMAGPVRWRRTGTPDARMRAWRVFAGWAGMPPLAGLILACVGRRRVRRARSREGDPS